MTTTRVNSPASEVRFGMARADVTPPADSYHRVWGAARHDRATGIHRPLMADVMAFGPRDTSSPAMIRVELDLVGLIGPQHEELMQAISASASVPPENVVITYSHTHASGRFEPNRFDLPGGERIPGYLLELKAKLAEAAASAVAAMQGVTITYAHGHCNMAANRDYWDEANGIYVCGYNPDAPADDSVLVARITDDAGCLVATAVNYACHATTLAWENTLISPDFVGAMRTEMERTTGAPCIYLLGPSGDLAPRDDYTGDPSVADKNGRQLAFGALAALESMDPPGTDFEYAGPVISGATLGTWRHVPFSSERYRQAALFTGGSFVAQLPLKSKPDASTLERQVGEWEERKRRADERGDRTAARDAGARAERARRWLAYLRDMPAGETYPLGFSAYRMGDAVWATCGGEPYSLLQTELRRRFPRLSLIVSPLAGDFTVAYLMPADYYGQGLYQEEPSILAAGCLEALIDAMADRIQRLMEDAAPCTAGFRPQWERGDKGTQV